MGHTGASATSNRLATGAPAPPATQVMSAAVAVGGHLPTTGAPAPSTTQVVSRAAAEWKHLPSAEQPASPYYISLPYGKPVILQPMVTSVGHYDYQNMLPDHPQSIIVPAHSEPRHVSFNPSPPTVIISRPSPTETSSSLDERRRRRRQRFRSPRYRERSESNLSRGSLRSAHLSSQRRSRDSGEESEPGFSHRGNRSIQEWDTHSGDSGEDDEQSYSSVRHRNELQRGQHHHSEYRSEGSESRSSRGHPESAHRSSPPVIPTVQTPPSPTSQPTSPIVDAYGYSLPRTPASGRRKKKRGFSSSTIEESAPADSRSDNQLPEVLTPSEPSTSHSRFYNMRKQHIHRRIVPRSSLRRGIMNLGVRTHPLT